jgi:fucose 4-O-acetylase-like acetyltransferase
MENSIGEKKKMLKRVDEIDIAKGIGIILVVLGHSIPDANTGIQNFWGG